MSVATVASRALAGIEAPEVTVEVHLGPGLPAFHIVGPVSYTHLTLPTIYSV